MSSVDFGNGVNCRPRDRARLPSRETPGLAKCGLFYASPTTPHKVPQSSQTSTFIPRSEFTGLIVITSYWLCAQLGQ